MNNSNYFNFKKVFLTVFLSGISLLASAQVVTFTDTIFRQAVTANPLIDLNDDGLIQLTEAAAFNGTIDVSNLGINDLTGIQSFTLLYSLNCNYNLLTSLDVSGINSLVVLNCLSNSLTSLNVSNNPNLFELNCSNNFLTSIDVSALSSLNIFYCYNNLLFNLDVSNNPLLFTLYCFQNQLSTIDVSTNTALHSLYCGNNLLSSLDVSNNANLAFFSIEGNNINTVDLSSNINLYYFICSNTTITNLDLTGLNSLTYLNASSCGPITNITFPGAALLDHIEIQDNQLTGLNVNSYTGLTYLNVSNNLFTSLDLTSNTVLEYVSCAGNQITQLDLGNADSLTALFCNNNQLQSLNIQNGNNINLVSFNATSNPNLTCVQVDDAIFMNNNWAASIDATANYNTSCNCVVNIPDANFKAALLANLLINTNADAEIQCGEASAYNGALNVSNLSIADLTGIEGFVGIDTLICTDNSLTSLDVAANTSLIYLCFSNNQLSTIDLASNTQLIEVCGQFNQLTSIDVSANTALKYLYLSSNQLSSLNVSDNVALWYLSCSINNLSSLDVTNCIQLVELNCSDNQISSLDLSNNTDMYYVYCDNNLLTSIDLSSDTSLLILNCNNNNLGNLNIQNGNNIDLTTFNATNNPNLTCVQVDDVTFMNTNWAAAIDVTVSYSLYCDPCDALPSPQFTMSTNNIGTSPATVVFTNTTPNLALYDFLWHFGDGSAMNNDDATLNYTYNTNGNFEISLTLNDPLTGCSVTNYDPANAAQTVVCNVPSANICGFTPSINPNGLINACQGSTVELNLNAGSYPAGSIIQWNKDGVTVIGENYSNHFVTENGFYTVTVFGPNGCPVVSDPVQVQYNLPAISEPSINATGTSGPCGQINLTLTANGSFASYLWSNGQTGTTLNVTQAGVYSVIGQSGVGCHVTSAPYSVSTSTFSTPEICMVDVDTITNHAIIVWEKPLVSGIVGFGIYKESALYSENYQQIAVVPYDSLSEFIDLNSDASIIAERYRISVIDNCGGESATSMPARVIGLKVLPGIGNQRVLTWNYYVSSAQNFTEYKIYSGANLNSLSLLTSVPASINSNYIDANPINGLNTMYRIYADMIIPCESTTRGIRNRSVSNGTGNLMPVFTATKEINENNTLECKLFPNPNNGIFSLAFTSAILKNNYTIQVFDMLGNIVHQTQFESTANAEINLSHLANGVYNIRMNSGNKQLNKRLLITK